MNKYVIYSLFVNMFNLNGHYSKRFTPDCETEGASLYKIKTWLNSHHNEHSEEDKDPLALFCLCDFYVKNKINRSIKRGNITHLLGQWFNHVFGLSVYKDQYQNYFVIYTNKGQSSIIGRSVSAEMRQI